MPTLAVTFNPKSVLAACRFGNQKSPINLKEIHALTFRQDKRQGFCQLATKNLEVQTVVTSETTEALRSTSNEFPSLNCMTSGGRMWSKGFRFEQHVIDFRSISIFLVVDPFRHFSGELTPLFSKAALCSGTTKICFAALDV